MRKAIFMMLLTVVSSGAGAAAWVRVGETAYTDSDPATRALIVPSNAGELLWKPAHNSSAVAGWVAVGSTDNFTIYVDPATTRKWSNMVKMWAVTDYKKVQVSAGIKPYLSMRQQLEYDCGDEQVRWLSTSLHNGKMAGGELVAKDADIGNWQPVPPGTTGEVLWTMACGEER
jgi:hypothetical protein